MLTLALFACTTETVSVLQADPSRDGLDGSDGPFGVQRVTDLGADPPNDRFEAIGADGSKANVGFAAATLVFLQGGSVPAERYHWLAAHFASRGATVLVPHTGFDLAIVDTTAGTRALAAAVEAGAVDADVPVGVLGHSLGGVVAAMEWAANDTIQGVALLAAYPSEDTNVEGRTTGSMISVLGSDDGKASAEDVTAGADRFSITHALVTIPGMNHYDWTDGATDGELATDGDSTLPLPETRTNAQWALDGWVDSCVTSSVGSWPFYAAAHPDTATGDPCDLMVMAE